MDSKVRQVYFHHKESGTLKKRRLTVKMNIWNKRNLSLRDLCQYEANEAEKTSIKLVRMAYFYIDSDYKFNL